jgi:predicted NUDIX family phosphoesterase
MGGHAGRILVVPRAEFERLGHFQGFCPDAGRYLAHLLTPEVARFLPRAEMEQDPSFKQIIPYVVFRCGRRVFVYTRGTSQGEARLHRLRSLGVGGHVDEADADGRATYEAYLAALGRELEEEVAIGSPGVLRLAGLINDDETPVGRVHLGVVHVHDLDGEDLAPREDGLAEAGFRDLDDLTAIAHEFESWSAICLESVLGVRTGR